MTDDERFLSFASKEALTRLASLASLHKSWSWAIWAHAGTWSNAIGLRYHDPDNPGLLAFNPLESAEDALFVMSALRISLMFVYSPDGLLTAVEARTPKGCRVRELDIRDVEAAVRSAVTKCAALVEWRKKGETPKQIP